MKNVLLSPSIAVKFCQIAYRIRLFLPRSYDLILRSNGHHGSVIFGHFLLVVHWSREHTVWIFGIRFHGANCFGCTAASLAVHVLSPYSPALFLPGVESRCLHTEKLPILLAIYFI